MARRRSTCPASGRPFKKQLARDADRFDHRLAEAIVEPAREQIFDRIIVFGKNIERQIHAIFFQIDDHVLPEIGQLQRGAGGVRQFLARRVAIAAQTQHQPADGIRRIAAVLEQLFEILVAGDLLVLLERLDQIVERFLQQIVPRGRVLKRDEHRMLRLARIHGLQFASPPGEQTEAFLGIADLVGQIVGPAAERVDVIEVLVQTLRQQKADDMKIFVMIRRQPAGVGERFLARPRLL